jgi:hypothetical protein
VPCLIAVPLTPGKTPVAVKPKNNKKGEMFWTEWLRSYSKCSNSFNKVENYCMIKSEIEGEVKKIEVIPAIGRGGS